MRTLSLVPSSGGSKNFEQGGGWQKTIYQLRPRLQQMRTTNYNAFYTEKKLFKYQPIGERRPPRLPFESTTCTFSHTTHEDEMQQPPTPLNLQNILYCVFAKYIYTLQALLLCSLNPKFYTGSRQKLYAHFTFCFSFWGTSFHRPTTGALPLDPTGGLPSPRPPGPPHHVNLLHCKIMGTPMCRSFS